MRIKLAQVQRAVAQAGDVVMDGREIGSYVLPDTPHKFFVTASLEERARRRWTELQEMCIRDRPDRWYPGRVQCAHGPVQDLSLIHI